MLAKKEISSKEEQKGKCPRPVLSDGVATSHMQTELRQLLRQRNEMFNLH